MFFRIIMALTMVTFQSAFASKLHSIEDCPDNKNHFAHQVVKKLAKVPCGHLGSVENRIADCKKAGAKAKGNFILVSRTSELNEIYLDESTGMLWGDVLKNKFSHKLAMQACRDSLAEVGKIAGRNWRLPTYEEVKNARTNYNKNKKKHEYAKKLPLPNMDEYQWTSSTDQYNKKFRHGYGEDAYTSMPSTENLKVRCVSAE